MGKEKSIIAVGLITIFLISFIGTRIVKMSSTITSPSNPPETNASAPSEDDIQANTTFQKFSALIPSVTFTHVESTTSAKMSRATIMNPREKYCVGESLIVQIEMFDYLINRKTYGGDFIKARIFSPDLEAAASGRIEDFNNGTYHVQFTLRWAGKVYVSLVLHLSSEAASALWRARNKDYGLISFVGTFGNGTHYVKSKCGFQLNTEKETCEYKNEEDELFYCYKSTYFDCRSFIYLQSFNRSISYLTTLEKALFKRENNDIEIPTNFEFIDVRTCTVTSPSRLPPCKIGMKSPFPSGFVFQDKWRPVFCNISDFTLQQMHHCLEDKMIYLIGDGTLRQWYLYLVNRLQEFKNFDLQQKGLKIKLLSVDIKGNTKLQWKKHSHPTIARQYFSIKEDFYTSEQIDQLAGGPNYVLIVSLGQNFRPFPIHLFIKRLIHVHKALTRLFLRSPNTKVIIKTENTRGIHTDPEKFSDFHGYIQYLILKDIFRDLPVAVIDAWDMTVAYNSQNVHPDENIIREQVHMFLTYIC